MTKFRVVLALLVALPLAAQHHRAVNPAQLETITILQTTDIHDHANGAGHVGLDVDPATGMGTVGAYARIASYVGLVRATAGHPVVLVDSGDWTMGTLYDLTLVSRPLALYFITAMRYDAITIGNHEWDYTPAGLAGMLAAAKGNFGFHTPIVASNMNLNGNADLAPFYGAGKTISPTYVETLSNGMRVGFIGLMGEDAAVDAASSAPVTFTPLSSDYAAIQAMVDDLRNAQGAQVVIALSHSGTDASGTSGEDVELARHVHGINVIASGHTHTPLASAHAVANGTWTTQIIDAGAFGTNVARFDLTVRRGAGSVTPIAFNNVAMTDASLASLHSGLKADPATEAVVNATDQQLNASLGPVLKPFFPDYSATSLGKGIYHPVAVAAQDMVPNDHNPVLSPNGLGDLAADSVRNVPNAIIGQTLAAVGGNPANLPGYDFTPFQVGVVATGVIRNSLPAAVPLSFADIYDVLPLGLSPDQTQALPVGYPMISAYVDLNDLKKILALQLVAQENFVGSSFYLNISGVKYTLDPGKSYTYFKYATAAAVLDVTNRKAAAGSAAAAQAANAMFIMGYDHGAALTAASAAGNPYATAMVKLNDASPDASQTNANLTAMGEVGSAAIYGTASVSALVVSKAVDAIDSVQGFAPNDLNNTGAATSLTGTTRYRITADLYDLLLLNAVQQEFGITVTPYQSATGTVVLNDIPKLLGNRIDLLPATPGVQELKEWMALLGDVAGTTIGPEYFSTPIFSQFPTFGAAVKNRNPSYPLPAIAQLIQTEVALQGAP